MPRMPRVLACSDFGSVGNVAFTTLRFSKYEKRDQDSQKGILKLIPHSRGDNNLSMTAIATRVSSF